MTPFSTADLFVLDVVRSLTFLVGSALAGLYLRNRWSSTSSTGERTRVLAMAGALFVLAVSRLTHLGQPPTWELLASIIIFALMAHSVVSEARR